MNADRIAQLEPRALPSAAAIIQEVRDSILTAQTLGVFTKINTAHETRRCLWPNQHDDGMKHGADAFPYDRAIDSRVPLAEEIVTEHVRVRMAAVRGGNVSIGPMNQIEDSDKSKLWNDVLKYYRSQNRRSMKNHWKLFQTCVEEIGYGILHLDWRESRVLKPQTLTREQIISFLAASMMETMQAEAQLPEGETLPPESQQMAADLATMQTDEMLVNPMLKEGALALLQQMDPTMPESEARRVITQLSRADTATYYAPRGAGGLPAVKARIPWVDCGHAMDLGPDGKCSWWFLSEWLSEVDLRQRCEQEQCDEEWLKAVLGQPNKGLSELMQLTNLPRWLLNGVGLGLSYDTQQNERAPMFQVLTVYRLAVNSAGIPAVYETLVHPLVPDLLGKHELCAVAELPFIAEARESASLMVQSRGIPEIVLTDQLGLKKLKDGITAMAELAAFPPYERAMGDNQRLAPGVDLPVRRNTGTNGTQSRFLEVPGVDRGALEAMAQSRADVDRLFARGKDMDPDTRRLYLEDMGESAVLSYEELMRLLWLHIQAYVDEVVATRIAGRPVSVRATAEDLEGTADVVMEFSSMAFNQATALELADYVTKLAGLDRSGRIDFGRAVEMITRIFDPVLSENIILPGEAAAAEIEKDEQGVIAAIASGQYITGRVNSPETRWKVLQNWLANPSTVSALQTNPLTYAALSEHIKGLQQEMVQRGENVFTGQTGQKPEAPWQQDDKPEAALKQMVEGPSAQPMSV